MVIVHVNGLSLQMKQRGQNAHSNSTPIIEDSGVLRYDFVHMDRL